MKYIAGVLGLLAVFLTAMPSLAKDADLATPEGAIAAYIDGVAQRDITSIIAASAAEDMSKGFDFVANVDRLKMLAPFTPAPATDPFFIEMNKAAFVAGILGRVKFLTYGLMTDKDIVKGNTTRMDAAAARDFASVVRADRLSGLKLVKVGIPFPAVLHKEIYQANGVKFAKIYGADAATERVALISFEGLDFVIGFQLLRYGNKWVIESQTSPISGLNALGTPERMTPEKFESMLK